MVTPKQLHRLATRPQDHLRFVTTGRLPQGQRPQGPLVDLLKQIAPRDRIAMVGVTVDASLGYQGSRRFANAEQAFHWVHPSEEVFDSFPADSWRHKQFARRLGLEDLLARCERFPESLVQRYSRLCTSPPAAARAVPADPFPADDEGSPGAEPRSARMRP